MLHRTLFEPEHDMFREAFRKFVETEITPHHAAWEADQHISREAWLKAGEQGFLCPTMPQEYSGCLLYTSPSPRDVEESRMPSSA